IKEALLAKPQFKEKSQFVSGVVNADGKTITVKYNRDLEINWAIDRDARKYDATGFLADVAGHSFTGIEMIWKGRPKSGRPMLFFYSHNIYLNIFTSATVYENLVEANKAIVEFKKKLGSNQYVIKAIPYGKGKEHLVKVAVAFGKNDGNPLR
ncbi:MAG: hypothetical protein NTW04_06340, partial [Elusimicrobia bacterium]|nr:hypothetical protein [Elusimicrobiota bacterium]